MNLSRIAVLVQVALVALPVSVKAQEQMTVSPNMDIFRAGGYDDGSNGESPALYAFRAKPGRVLAFSAVLGLWGCADGGSYYGPDGSRTLCGNFSIAGPIGPFAGFDQTDFAGALVGMFLEDSLPESAPRTLRFYVEDSSKGGIATDFLSLAPRIGQVFFIGDGRTDKLPGHIQSFVVPETATRLYLGYVDSCTNHGGYSSPGCYSDNFGGMTAVFRLYDLN